MLKTIKIEGYRGIKLLELDNLARVNILLGENGSGKTSVLEAISLMSNPTPYQHIKLANWRDMRSPKLGDEDALSSIFFADHEFKAVCLTARYDQGKKDAYQQTLEIKPVKRTDNYTIDFEVEEVNGSLNLDMSDNALVGVKHLIFINNQLCSEQTLLLSSKGGKISARSSTDVCDGELEFEGSFFIDARRSTRISESASMISRLFRSLADKKRFMAALQSVAPQLVDIQIGFQNNSPTIYADIGQDRLTPINGLGDGFNRIFLIMTGLIGSGKQLVLVDEIDSGLHYSVMDKFWQDIDTLTGNGMQLFCATHNDEMLRSTLSAFSGSEQQLQIIRLDRAPSGVVTPIYYTVEEYKEAVDFGFDIR